VYDFPQSFAIILPIPSLTKLLAVNALYKVFQNMQFKFQTNHNLLWGSYFIDFYIILFPGQQQLAQT
jgi:hypothetical protein